MWKTFFKKVDFWLENSWKFDFFPHFKNTTHTSNVENLYYMVLLHFSDICLILNRFFKILTSFASFSSFCFFVKILFVFFTII